MIMDLSQKFCDKHLITCLKRLELELNMFLNKSHCALKLLKLLWSAGEGENESKTRRPEFPSSHVGHPTCHRSQFSAKLLHPTSPHKISLISSSTLCSHLLCVFHNPTVYSYNSSWYRNPVFVVPEPRSTLSYEHRASSSPVHRIRISSVMSFLLHGWPPGNAANT
jgi:hypothetical protein